MHIIPIENLFYMLIPIIVVWYFYKKWTGNTYEIPKATIRMTIQLILIGYALIYIFDNDSYWLGLIIITFMMIAATFISLRNIKEKSKNEFIYIFTSIFMAGSFNLFLVTEFVIELNPSYQPRYIIPLAGMIYANCMNTIALAGERLEKEIKRSNFIEARKTTLNGALIPQINAFLAVGLVSLPGMMTGQILSGVDPIVAVRYQIVVMGMVLASSGMSLVIYLLLKGKFDKLE